MGEIKVIIFGGREFDNYNKLKKRCDFYLQRYEPEDVTIISGKARGADRLGERYAKERGMKLISKPADWDRYGKKAGFIRNREMAEIGTHAIGFWDGKSVGTKMMIGLANDYNLKLKVVRY